MRILLVADRRSSEIGSLAIFSTLRTLSSGMASLSASLPGRSGRSKAASGARCGDLVDRLDHMHGIGWARLIGDARVMAAGSTMWRRSRTCSRGEFDLSTASSADIAFRIRSRTAGRDWCTSWQSRSRGADLPDHFLLASRASRSPFCTILTIRRNSEDSRPSPSEALDFAPDISTRSLRAHERLPALPFSAWTRRPVRLQSLTDIHGRIRRA